MVHRFCPDALQPVGSGVCGRVPVPDGTGTVTLHCFEDERTLDANEMQTLVLTMFKTETRKPAVVCPRVCQREVRRSYREVNSPCE